MAYTHPSLVNSPKNMVKDLDVIYNSGENGFSIARFKWDGNPVIGVRWNGGSNDPRFPGIGNPQSRGVPTWFVLPEPLADAVMKHGIEIAISQYGFPNLQEAEGGK